MIPLRKYVGFHVLIGPAHNLFWHIPAERTFETTILQYFCEEGQSQKLKSGARTLS
jgi:hypothetical protein